ncbi:MAG: nucleotidyltransferase [Lachnospiraceae bacterium]|uniref:Nucleotidyltransferase n=1 Tax=Candidatus Weimeria bifida TaxID=2599074 RepID=A0A6N7J2B5_9FIRM|nr:nucleotidyltransferase [Candidatus Weimeria bifida]RRF96594.1 MAG: nucleotidyltransferase [Lachnospiraceae bacterium]
MKDISLVIMAAGIGSRFGEGIKQLSPVGEDGSIIMDYSVHDAIEAGFNEIVFIIRDEIEKDFMDIIGKRVEKMAAKKNVRVYYVKQSLTLLPDGFSLPKGRTKPWGTGKAVLSASTLLDKPFAVINADDYYGKEAFRVVADYLKNVPDGSEGHYCMAGFLLKNTLSDFGTVTRGVCAASDDGYLTGIDETHDIEKLPDGGAKGEHGVLDVNSLVSMNMWGFTPDFMPKLEKGFEDFLDNLLNKGNGDPMKDEFLIPEFVGELLEKKEIDVKVLKSHDTWYGLTYKEDVPAVQASFKKMVEEGIYPSPLY